MAVKTVRMPDWTHSDEPHALSCAESELAARARVALVRASQAAEAVLASAGFRPEQDLALHFYGPSDGITTCRSIAVRPNRITAWDHDGVQRPARLHASDEGEQPAPVAPEATPTT